MWHRFSQSRLIWSWFVCIAVLQKYSAFPFPGGYSVRVGKRRQKRKGETSQAATKEESKATARSLRGCRHCCVCSREDKLLYNSSVILHTLKQLHAHKQITACLLATQTKYNAFAVPIIFHAAKVSIAPLSCNSYYSTAPVLHVHIQIIPLH